MFLERPIALFWKDQAKASNFTHVLKTSLFLSPGCGFEITESGIVKLGGVECMTLCP